jgi:hypothetical protein
MPFKSETYRVLIASPSDLEDERKVATDAINEWNAQHAAAEGVVLLPVKWETHALPETGVRPQGVINRQLVASSDLFIGMFWTKIGTNTGVADSGTVEEIDQFVSDGKPAMLYFSSRPVNPNRIDLAQIRRLRKFKDATYRTALVGGFTSTEELKSTLLRDLSARVRQMRGAKRQPGQRDKMEQAEKLTHLILLHKQHGITPEQIDRYKELLGITGRGRKSGSEPESDYRGLFFDYAGVIGATINKAEPKEGWSCSVDIVGDNYENKKFEINSFVVGLYFASSEEALEHGKRILELLGVECVDTRIEEL